MKSIPVREAGEYMLTAGRRCEASRPAGTAQTKFVSEGGEPPVISDVLGKFANISLRSCSCFISLARESIALVSMSYVRTLFHIVFRTKESVPALSSEYAKELFLYIWGFCKEKNCKLIRVNGMPDHLHLLLRLHPDIALSAFVRDLKIATGLWLKNERKKFPLFSGWARSYAAFSYSSQEQATIAAYIENQQEHHRKQTFAEEFRTFLEENGIPVDERYFLSE